MCACALCTSVNVHADIRQRALELGVNIDRHRQQPHSLQQINDMLAQTAALAAEARTARVSREKSAGDSETQLENLYRSPVWGDIGFALAAARYWRAWLLFDRYQLSGVTTDLESARKGFQTTLVLIVYPGLVRGSWLGLGYVAVAEQQYQAAETWFRRVAGQDHALAAQAERELELLAVLMAPQETRQIDELSAAAAELSPQQVDQLEAEAMALLERHGRTLDGASRAAQRLSQLESAGALNAQRVTRLLRYRDDIIGHPIGPVGLLVSAENALDHQQYYTAVEHYRKFFAAVDAARKLDFADYQLRYANALISSGLAAEAAGLLQDKLIPYLSETAAYFTLRHLAAATMYAQSGDPELRQTALLSAREVTERASPGSNPGAEFVVNLLTARISHAEMSAKVADETVMALLPGFELVYRELHRPRKTSQRTELAQLGLKLYRTLPKSSARAPWALLAEAEMKGYTGMKMARYLAYLDRLGSQLAAAGSAKPDELFAMRVSYLRRTNPAHLLTEVETTHSVSPAQRDTLLRELLDCDPYPWCNKATKLLIKQLQPASAQMLFARLQQIRLLNQASKVDQAYQQAAKLIAEYPTSGDALSSYAAAAAAVGRAADADAAYARIAESLPLGSDEWRDARRQQLALRLRAARPQDVCALQTVTYGDAMLSGEVQRGLESADINCNAHSGGL